MVRLVRLAALMAAGVIVVLFATQWDRWVGLAVRQVTDDAYVRGDITPLSAQVEGYVRRVPVDDFQRVKQGELLVQIGGGSSDAIGSEQRCRCAALSGLFYPMAVAAIGVVVSLAFIREPTHRIRIWDEVGGGAAPLVPDQP